ncbi:hypothetical protein CHS0354_035565 [Potamilus streckersoni]|uniref:Uncharacterized protein n=1 Tax=Potamilus streckersoni TaxID=2493646 RepID=A0AAE0RSK6_9BIVA|nr:hypothetical protein CHS0354_035565 [Potamilus streckersoni]
MNKMTIVGAVCVAVSLILGVAAIAVPKWLAFYFLNREVTFGLWRACATLSTGQVTCASYEKTPDWIIATSVFEVVGICGIIFAVLSAFFHIFIAKNSRIAGQAPGPCAIAGGLCMIVGVIIWAAKYKKDPIFALLDLSVGFILAILSAILSIIAGILLLLGWRAESSENSYSAI